MKNSLDISIHDNYIVEYTVNSVLKEIVLKTEFRDRPEIEKTDVLFSGVIGYHFQYDCLGSILYDIEQVDPNVLLKENLNHIKESARMSGALANLSGSEEESKIYFRESGIKGFYINCSLGLDGWIFAKAKVLVSKK